MRVSARNFKTCRNKINRDVYETVCAFLNRHGGTILFGVQDDGTLQGIEPDAVTQIKKEFVTSVNNPLKLMPPTYLSVDVVEMDEKSLLRIYVPESSQVHRCNGRIYDRNEDGNLDITDHRKQGKVSSAGRTFLLHQSQQKSLDVMERAEHPSISISIDGRGRALVNIFLERLWWYVKYEDIYLKNSATPAGLHCGLKEYFLLFNVRLYHE